jgi:hypothetical protein
MLWDLMKENPFITSTALCAVFFFLPLCSMEPAEPIKKKKKPTLLQRLKQLKQAPLLVNCGLTDQLIPQEVMALISRNLTLQDLGRLNRLNKAIYWDLEHICDCAKKKCSTVACIRLKQCHYDTRTKVLTHYAQARNAMIFNHLWIQDQETRCLDLDVYLQSKSRPYPLQIKKMMKECVTHYRTPQKIEKRRLKQLVSALCYGDVEAEVLLQKILPGSHFNVFYSAREYRKKQVRKTNRSYYLRNIFRNACNMQDGDFILAMLGGKIEPRAFKYIFAYAERGVINSLKWKNAFVAGIRDKHGKNIEDYMEDYDCSAERKYLELLANRESSRI